jgi:hypothetical protein
MDMRVLLRCLDNDIGGKNGEWIRPLEESCGDLDGGGMNCSGEMEVGLLDWTAGLFGYLYTLG